MRIRIRVLGRLEVDDGGQPVPIPQRKLRQVLCVLTLAAGPISSDFLQGLLWDADTDRDMASALTTTMHKLRQALPDGHLVKTDEGYQLADTNSDLDEFRTLVDQARTVRETDPAKASRHYRQAVDLWGDPPLSSLPDTAPMADAAARLLVERREAREALVEVCLALGHHDTALASEVRAMLLDDPLNEHLWAQLMLCLYRDDRKADALLAHQDATDALATELGTVPGNLLQRLADQINRNDPALDWRRPPPPRLPEERAASVNTKKASPARVYDYLLDGKDHFPSDRDVADSVLAVVPQLRDVALGNRAFLRRAVRLLAKDGVSQFVDLGSGLPTADNVHEVARRVIPDAHVVYVDNDPIVGAHARAVLLDDPRTAFIEADVKRPAAILEHPETIRLIDWSKPVAVLAFTTLHFLSEEEARETLAAFTSRMVPGSYLATSQVTSDGSDPEATARLHEAGGRSSVDVIHQRTRAEITALLVTDGWELLEPGVMDPGGWRAEDPIPLGPLRALGGVARRR
jgi:DNA-binding SARP family transcriptional activator